MEAATPDESKSRSGFRRTLVYFGLAIDPTAPPSIRTARRRLIESLFLTSLICVNVGSHRGTTVGWLSVLLFAPLLAVDFAKWVGWLAERKTSEAISVPALFIGSALWIAPRHDTVWIPIAIAGVLSVLVLTPTLVRSRRRRAATAAG